MRVVLLPDASRDLDEIWWYVARQSGSTMIADRLIGHIEESILKIGREPGIGRVRPELASGLRSVSVGSYLIFYRRRRRKSEVVRIVHGSRNLPKLF